MEFYLDEEIQCKRSFNGTVLRCLDEITAKVALQELHEGICATHARGHMMARQINPKANNKHQFILVAIDYFTKWVKTHM